jgi:hypothetical protein
MFTYVQQDFIGGANVFGCPAWYRLRLINNDLRSGIHCPCHLEGL